MIQRIQSVFLLLAVLCAASLLYTGLDTRVLGSALVVPALSGISLLLALISFFSYKKRSNQIMLNGLNMIVNVLLIGLLMFWLLTLPGGMEFPEKGIEPVFPAVALFCLFMANLYIRRDERLVKSVDRIR